MEKELKIKLSREEAEKILIRESFRWVDLGRHFDRKNVYCSWDYLQGITMQIRIEDEESEPEPEQIKDPLPPVAGKTIALESDDSDIEAPTENSGQ